MRYNYGLVLVLIFLLSPSPLHAKKDEISRINEEGAHLYKLGKFTEAEPFYKRALVYYENLVGKNHFILGKPINNLAKLYSHLSRFDEAETLYKRILAIREKTFGKDNYLVGISLNNLATLYSYQGRYNDAEELYIRSLKISESFVKRDDPLLMATLNNLAKNYFNQGRYTEAEQLFKRTIAIREKFLGNNHLDLSISLNDLADFYNSSNRYNKAEKLYKRALAIREKALGKNHPYVGYSRNGLAALYTALGRYDKAEKQFKRSLDILEGKLDKNHIQIGAVLNNFGQLNYLQGRYDKAESLFKRSLDISKTLFLDHHISTAIVLNNLAKLNQFRGQYVNALQFYKRALVISENTLGKNHILVAQILNNLAALYDNLNSNEEAKKFRKRADAIPLPATRQINITFATNRRVVSKDNIVTFGSQINETINFGKAKIIILHTDITKRIDRQFIKNKKEALETNLIPSSSLFIRNISQIKKKALKSTIKERLQRSFRYKKQIMIFVHGYKTTFEAAVQRIAQLSYELDFDGPSVLFSWASANQLLGYGYDRASAEVAVNHLLEFIETLNKQFPEAKLNFMAHSMGNMVVLQALEKLALKIRDNDKPNIGEVILAHPDVDEIRFKQLIQYAKPLKAGFTLYASSDDKAIGFSGWLRNLSRAGSKPIFVEGLQSIDITGLGASYFSLNHTIFAKNPIVFGDIRKLLKTSQRPPHKRTRFFKKIDTEKGVYWRYKSE